MGARPRLDFDPAGHVYRLDGAVVPGVTTVIASLYDFSSIPAWILDRKSAIGRAVHLATELYDDGDLDEESVDPVVRPYLDAWIRFRKETGCAVLHSERQMSDPLLRYAGTVDRVLAFGSVRWIADIKSTVVLDPAVGVQTAGYKRLAIAEGLADESAKRAAVQLRPDGTYRFVPYEKPDDERCFLSLLNVYHWRQKNHG